MRERLSCHADNPRTACMQNVKVTVSMIYIQGSNSNESEPIQAMVDGMVDGAGKEGLLLEVSETYTQWLLITVCMHCIMSQNGHKIIRETNKQSSS